MPWGTGKKKQLEYKGTLPKDGEAVGILFRLEGLASAMVYVPLHFDSMDGGRGWAPEQAYLSETQASSPCQSQPSHKGSLSCSPDGAHTRTPLVSAHYSSSHLSDDRGTEHPRALQICTTLAPEDLPGHLWHSTPGTPGQCLPWFQPLHQSTPVWSAPGFIGP